MALTISLETTDFGIPLSDTYARVMTVKSDKYDCKIVVKHFVNKAASDEGVIHIAENIYRVPLADFPTGSNPMAAAYEWVKQQPEYSGATDS